jgi:hypothetical protein
MIWNISVRHAPLVFCNPKLRRSVYGTSRGMKGSLFPVKMNVLSEPSAGRDPNPAMACSMAAYNPTVMPAPSFRAERSTLVGSPETLDIPKE